MKSTWKIINEEKGKSKQGINIQSLVTDNKVLTNQNQIANIFNNRFLSVAHSINSNSNIHLNTNMTMPINYLANNFRRPFSKISWQSTSTYEIEKINKSLKAKNTCGYNEISN
jgi:hypothetical protein